MRKSPLVIIAIAALQITGMAQPINTKRTTHRESFLVDQSKPYVYLEVDHIGPRQPERDGEPKEGIWLRLHNNCMVPIIVGTFGVSPNSPAGEVGVIDNVVENPPPGIGDGSFSYEPWPTEKIPSNLASALGLPLSEASTQKTAASKPSQKAGIANMPHGYMFPARSSAIIEPGQSIYFSLPRNQVSPKWHVEIPFRFDLKVRSPIRSAYNFLALFEEDVIAKAASPGLR